MAAAAAEILWSWPALPRTANAAQIARTMLEEEKPEVNVHVFNTCSASPGETLVALKIKELAEKGVSFKEVVQKWNNLSVICRRSSFWNHWKTFVKTGVWESFRRCWRQHCESSSFSTAVRRARLACWIRLCQSSRLLNKLISYIVADGNHNGKTLVISHCNCYDRAFWLKSQIEPLCNFANVLIVETRGIATVYADNGGIVCAY